MEKIQKNKLHHMSVKDGILVYVPVVLFVLIAVIPFITMISGSLSSPSMIKEYGVALWPKGFSTSAYELIFRFPDEMINSYLITILVTVAGTLLNMVLLLTLANYLCKSTHPSTKYISFFIFFTLMFQAGLVPTYIVYTDLLHIKDTIWVLILVPALSVGHLFLLRMFISAVPSALYESARIDGAGEFRILFRITIPLIVPGIATITFYSVLMYWNDPFTALMYTDNIVPVSLYLSRVTSYIEFLKFVQQGGIPGVSLGNMEIPDNTMIYAMAVVTTGPMMFIFVFFQKYFVNGLTVGGVKG